MLYTAYLGIKKNSAATMKRVTRARIETSLKSKEREGTIVRERGREPGRQVCRRVY